MLDVQLAIGDVGLAVHRGGHGPNSAAGWIRSVVVEPSELKLEIATGVGLNDSDAKVFAKQCDRAITLLVGVLAVVAEQMVFDDGLAALVYLHRTLTSMAEFSRVPLARSALPRERLCSVHGFSIRLRGRKR